MSKATPRPRSVSTSAPTRIDLAGGTLDIWPLQVLVEDAATINLAVELRAHATLEARSDRRAVFISEDRGRRLVRRLPLARAGASGALPLLVRLAATFEHSRGFTLTTRAEAPAGAGLGGSSALAIAVAAAFNAFTGARLSKAAILRRVANVEASLLHVPTGTQDYLAALHGGLSAWHHTVDGTRREALPVPSGLAGRLVLAYTGEPRGSGFSNWDMFRRFIDREAPTVRRMESIARIARELRSALAAGQLDRAGRLLGEEGKLRLELAPSVSTRAIERSSRAALRAGALGVKVCGAGGGGCLVAFAAAGRAARVAEALERSGAAVLTFRVARGGLRVSARGSESSREPWPERSIPKRRRSSNR